MKVTKRRDGEVWRVQFNGTDTPITIEKSEFAPRWGHTQEWFAIFGGGDNILFRANSAHECMSAVERIAKCAAGG